VNGHKKDADENPRPFVLGSACHCGCDYVANDDINEKRIPEEGASVICHLPGAFDHAVDSAGHNEFD
jgi:hypothetical protein